MEVKKKKTFIRYLYFILLLTFYFTFLTSFYFLKFNTNVLFTSYVFLISNFLALKVLVLMSCGHATLASIVNATEEQQAQKQ